MESTNSSNEQPITSDLSKAKEKLIRLENKLTNMKQKNYQNKKARIAKKSLLLGKLVAPYALSLALTSGICAVSKHIPFYINQKPKNTYVKMEMDSLGNSKKEETEDRFFYYPEGTISFRGTWEKQEDGTYQRKFETYSKKGIDNEITAQIANNQYMGNFEDIFGKPISEIVETRISLTEEELLEPPFFEGTLYYKKKWEDVPQTKQDDIEDAILFFSLIFSCWVLSYIIHKDYVNKSYDYESLPNIIKDINCNYPVYDIDNLQYQYLQEEAIVRSLEAKLK